VILLPQTSSRERAEWTMSQILGYHDVEIRMLYRLEMGLNG
jgi:hypothetical protein